MKIKLITGEIKNFKSSQTSKAVKMDSKITQMPNSSMEKVCEMSTDIITIKGYNLLLKNARSFENILLFLIVESVFILIPRIKNLIKRNSGFASEFLNDYFFLDFLSGAYPPAP